MANAYQGFSEPIVLPKSTIRENQPYLDAARRAPHDTRNALVAETYSRLGSQLTFFVGRNSSVSSEDREDIVQDTMIRVGRHAHHFNWEQKWSSWVYRIAKNLTYNHARNYGRNVVRPFAHYETQDASRSMLNSRAARQTYASEEFTVCLETILSNMNPHHGDPLRLRFLEGLSYDQIGKQLNLELGTVKSRLNRGRELLRAELQAANEHLLFSDNDAIDAALAYRRKNVR